MLANAPATLLGVRPGALASRSQVKALRRGRGEKGGESRSSRTGGGTRTREQAEPCRELHICS